MQTQAVNKLNIKPVKKTRQTLCNLRQLFLIASIACSTMITLYPFIYVLSMSLSDPRYVLSKSVWLWPKGFTFDAYKLVLNNEYIWQAYYNTIWYTLVGTVLNVLFTVIAAYPLSRKQFFLRNPIMMYIVLTMFFSGGLIPSFILVSQLGLYNTRWALILPHLVSAFYIIVARTFFQSIPDEMIESSKLDGANDFTILYRIIIPLSLPILAVLILFYAVDHWNSYFNAILYLSSGDLQPLQVYLMKVLIALSDEFVGNADTGVVRTAQIEQLKYASIIVVILPILFIYPFLQRFFVQGMLIGAVKE